MEKNYRLSDYDRARQEELNRANPAVFWLLYPLVVVGAYLLLAYGFPWVGL